MFFRLGGVIRPLEVITILIYRFEPLKIRYVIFFYKFYDFRRFVGMIVYSIF